MPVKCHQHDHTYETQEQTRNNDFIRKIERPLALIQDYKPERHRSNNDGSDTAGYILFSPGYGNSSAHKHKCAVNRILAKRTEIRLLFAPAGFPDIKNKSGTKKTECRHKERRYALNSEKNSQVSRAPDNIDRSKCKNNCRFRGWH